jgi:hypothetical protein
MPPIFQKKFVQELRDFSAASGARYTTLWRSRPCPHNLSRVRGRSAFNNGHRNRGGGRKGQFFRLPSRLGGTPGGGQSGSVISRIAPLF